MKNKIDKILEKHKANKALLRETKSFPVDCQVILQGADMNKSEISIINKRLAERIKLAREIKGIRQEDMAKSLSMSRTNYVNLESGKFGIYAHHLLRIIQILGVKPNTILQ